MEKERANEERAGGRKVNIYFMPIDIQYVYTKLRSFILFYTRKDIEMMGGGGGGGVKAGSDQ